MVDWIHKNPPIKLKSLLVSLSEREEKNSPFNEARKWGWDELHFLYVCDHMKNGEPSFKDPPLR
jgi:hypothetical protein